MKQYLIKHDTPPQEHRELLLVMPFGKYKGRVWDQVPDDYLILLADDFNRDKPGVLPDDRFKFKVPLNVREKARDVLKQRGYKKHGSRWTHER